MTPPDLRELAQQGDLNAIEALLNRQLQPLGMTAQTSLQGEECLIVLLESVEFVPDRYAVVQLIRNELTDLEFDEINRVKVRGRQAGQEELAWSHEVGLEVGTYSMLMVSQAQDQKVPVPAPATEANQSQQVLLEPQRWQKIAIGILTAVLFVALLVFAGQKLIPGFSDNIFRSENNQGNPTMPATQP
ncbi:hypothetical protein [Microcoleus sp. FACHB-672]|uniref:hypothetical protein n=1 Tax=Microcoleus sp. FACHB-672 TaxID=2692825 RepID=UPI001687A392|nr:hypothetical protein [Microcoleus sp. FACHB-672]MBD2040481.1 hypothetical protein [Microcoleus sp. FACHB-672]